MRCDEDPGLVDRLVRERVPLTVCPLSNLKLCVVPDLRAHNFARLLRRGVAVTINSDDPAYFGGYIADNYRATAVALNLTATELVAVAENAVAGLVPARDRQARVTRPDPERRRAYLSPIVEETVR